MIDLLKPIDLTTDDIKMLAKTHWLNQVVVNLQQAVVNIRKENKKENTNK